MLFEGAKSLVDKLMHLLQFSLRQPSRKSIKEKKLGSNENAMSQWLLMNEANIALTIEDKADIEPSPILKCRCSLSSS